MGFQKRVNLGFARVLRTRSASVRFHCPLPPQRLLRPSALPFRVDAFPGLAGRRRGSGHGVARPGAAGGRPPSGRTTWTATGVNEGWFFAAGGVASKRRRSPRMTGRVRQGKTVLPRRGGRDTPKPASFHVSRPAVQSNGCRSSIPSGGPGCPSLFGLTEQVDGIRGPPVPVCQVPHAGAHLQPLRPRPTVLRRPLRARGPARVGAGRRPALPKRAARPSHACRTDASLPRQEKESDASAFPATGCGCSTGIGPGGERDGCACRSRRINRPGIALSFLRVSLLAFRAVEFSGRASG
jgi:hypothetical protein